MHSAFKLLTLSNGQILGEDDLINERVRFATAVCTSSSMKAYILQASEFFRLIDSKEESRVEVRKQLYYKEKQITQRIEMIEGVYNIKPADIIARVALENIDLA